MSCSARIHPIALPRWLPCLVVGLSSLFYVYEFFLRVTPSVIIHELMRDLHINAEQLGLLGVSFYIAYTPMQIPAGLLIDRYGPRRLLTWAVLLCSLATFGFAHTTAYGFACLTRFLIGMASAFAFIGPLTLAARWFPSRHFAFIAGLIQLMGCAGAMIGGEPIAALNQSLGWQHTLVWTAGVGALIAIAFWWVIRDEPPTNTEDLRPETNPGGHWQRLRQVATLRQNWFTGLAGFASWVPVVVFAELWGSAFLKRAYGIDTPQAAAIINWIWVGVAIGSPLGGWLSDYLESRRMPLMVCYTLALIASCALLVGHPSLHALPGWMIIMGLSATAQPITFGLISDNNPSRVAGTAMGFQNMCVIAAASMQYLVGLLLQHGWQGHSLDGAPQYLLTTYQHALIVVPGCALVGLAAVLFGIDETHCQPSSLPQGSAS